MTETQKMLLMTAIRNAFVMGLPWFAARGFIPADSIPSWADWLAPMTISAIGLAWSFAKNWLDSRRKQRLAVSTAQLKITLDNNPANTSDADKIVATMAAQLAPSMPKEPMP